MTKLYNSFARRLSFYLCGVVAVFFCIATVIAIQQSVRQTAKEADRKAFAQLDIISHRTEKILVSVESAVNSVATDVEWELLKLQPDEQRLFDITHQLVQDNEYIVGSIISLPLHTLGDDRPYFAAYSAKDRQTDSVTTSQVGNADYDYTTMNWYVMARDKNRPYWSDPYFDEGAGNIIMCTYSKPLTKPNGEFLGVFTADIPLHWLSEKVNSFKPYHSSYNMMIAKDASYIAHPDSSRILRETIFATSHHDTDTMLHHIGGEMVRGKRGSAVFEDEGMRSTIFYTPIPITGWSVAMVCPNRDIYEGTHHLAEVLGATLLLALLLTFLVVYFVVRKTTQPLHDFSESAHRIAKGDFHTPLPQINTKDEMLMLRDSFHFMQTSLTAYIDQLKETTSAKERIESELNIARKIQMGIIPKIFPPYPERTDIDIFAFMQPAREVGGDLYDFFIDSDKLYIAVGDVSGKGVPASLFMAVTRSIFRSIAVSKQKPSEIIQSMNASMCEGNDTHMFVTLFIGILDLHTGQLVYSSAGHNPPVLVSAEKRAEFIDIASCTGLPIGLLEGFSYSDHTMELRAGNKLVLYTDGLTEAENKQHELYSDNRLIATLSCEGIANLSARDMLESLYADVEAHVDGAVQSDDLTMMVVEFKGTQQKMEAETEVEPEAEATMEATTPKSSNYQRIELPCEIDQLRTLTTWVEALCEQQGAEPSLTMRITLALEEAAANIVMYAYPAEQRGEFCADFNVTDSGIASWRLVDQGLPFDPTAKASPDLSGGIMERPIGGLGILLVKEIMDDVSYKRTGGQNILTMHINLKKTITDL